MARRKIGLFGSLRNKILAGVASLLATTATTAAALYWNTVVEHITGQPAQTAPNGHGGPTLLPTFSIQPQPASTKIGLLGCQAVEADKRVRITEVVPGSPAALLGLVPGDIVEEVGDHRIESTEALSIRLSQSRHFLHTTIDVRRGSTSLRGEVTLGSDNALTVHRPLH